MIFEYSTHGARVRPVRFKMRMHGVRENNHPKTLRIKHKCAMLDVAQDNDDVSINPQVVGQLLVQHNMTIARDPQATSCIRKRSVSHG